jgi:hypothetical protein
MVLVILFWSWYYQCLKMFNYDILIIKSEENIKYLYLHNLMSKIIFRVSLMIKHYFDVQNNIFSFIE